MFSPHQGVRVFFECGARFYAAKSIEEMTWASPLILAEEEKYSFYEGLLARFGAEIIHGIFFGTYNVSRKEKRRKEQEVFDFVAQYRERLFPGGHGLHIYT